MTFHQIDNIKKYFKKIIVEILVFFSKKTLKKYNPKIIAITGSVGKTSTKDAIFTVLDQSDGRVARSEKSFNSEIGVPLTILRLKNGWSNPITWLKNIFLAFKTAFLYSNYPEILILEIGADHKGDIERISKWLKTDIVVFTSFSETPAHIEFFKDKQEVLKEKLFLAKTLKKDGTLVVNSDDDDFSKYAQNHKGLVMYYGINASSHIYASNINFAYKEIDGFSVPHGISFKVDYEGKSIPVSVPGVLAKHYAYIFLAAFCVGIIFKKDLLSLSEKISEYEVPNGRQKLLQGIKHSLIIDDSYNSSPVAVSSALDSLEDLPTEGRKIAILGDMLELGKHSAKSHFDIGVRASFLDMLILVGQRSIATIEGAIDAGMPKEKIIHTENSWNAGTIIFEKIKEGDIVLVKGSQGIRLERSIVQIMKNPENAIFDLVRQDKQWLSKK